MKKTLPFLLIPILVAGLCFSAWPWGKRSDQPVQLTYHLMTEEPLPGLWTALSFPGDRPSMVATEKSVQFLGSSGQILVRLERSRNTRVFLSEKGNFVGIQEFSAAGEKPGVLRPLTFALYDVQGEKRWALKLILEGDEPLPSFYLSDLGRVVMVEPLEGMLSFYDQSGSLAREVRLFPDAAPETERPVACAFSAEGNHLVVNALRRHSWPGTDLSPREKGQSYLIMFDARGEEIWRQKLQQEISHRVDISPDGQVIVAGAYSVRGLDAVERATYLYDAGGKLFKAFEFPFDHTAFSSDGRILLLGHKRNFRLVDTSTGKVLWEKILPGETGPVRTLDLSPDGSLALAELARGMYQGPRFVYASPRVLLFDEEGHRVWQMDFPEDNFFKPLARFLEDGSRILLAFQDRYLIYAPDK